MDVAVFDEAFGVRDARGFSVTDGGRDACVGDGNNDVSVGGMFFG